MANNRVNRDSQKPCVLLLLAALCA